MSRDLRRYSHQTSIQLIIGFLIILFIVGEGLIYWLYGPGAATTGLLCILAGLSPLVFIGAFFLIVRWILKRADRD